MSDVPGEGQGGATIEREAKYRLDAAQAARLRARLDRDGRFLREETQITTVFKDRAASLEEGEYLRLRTTGSRTELTVKGPKTGTGLAAWRMEHSVTLGSGPIVELLELIGFTVRVRYIKRTRIYSVQRALVFLDDIDHLGWFCEIEIDDLDMDLEAVRDALELRDDDLEPRGYPTLVESVGSNSRAGHQVRTAGR